MLNLFKSNKDTSNTNQTTVVQEPEQPLAFRDEIRTNWKKLSDEKAISCSDMAALHTYRALMKGEGKEGAIGRLKKAFKPITKKVKLENGATPYESLTGSLYGIRYSTFAGWLTKYELDKLLELAKEVLKEKIE